jgi:pilus assembly protein FimV
LANLDAELSSGQPADGLGLADELASLDAELTGDQLADEAADDLDLSDELASLDEELVTDGAALDLDEELAAGGAQGDLDQELADLGLLDDDADDQVQTKLELAEAYVEMGDPEGARAILEEVVTEGSGEQQAKARALLGSMGQG